MDAILEEQHDRYLNDIRANQRVLADFCVIVHGGIALAGIGVLSGERVDSLPSLYLSTYLCAIVGLLSTTLHYLARAHYDAREERSSLGRFRLWLDDKLDADEAIDGDPPSKSLKNFIYIPFRISTILALLVLIQILSFTVALLFRQVF